MEKRKVRFVEPAKLYRNIKNEIDAVYFDVMSRGELIDRSHLKNFETNLAKFVGTKYAVVMMRCIYHCGLPELVRGMK